MTSNAADQPLRSISDTALWVAYYRALESERPDAIFHDPYARRLAGERGEQIVRELPYGRGGAWAMIVRTAIFDELTLQAVAGAGIDTVVNLAAGLDTRPYRLPVASSLRWVEVDLPEIIAYKEENLVGELPRCRLERVAFDLGDLEARRSFFARINEAAARALIVTEGLLAYLTPEQVGELATDLHCQPHFQFWLIDLASPAVLRFMKKHYGKALSAAHAPMHFAPAGGAEFFRPFGWELAEFRSAMEEGRRLKREMPMVWLLHFWARLAPRRYKKMMEAWKSGTALLGRL